MPAFTMEMVDKVTKHRREDMLSMVEGVAYGLVTMLYNNKQNYSCLVCPILIVWLVYSHWPARTRDLDCWAPFTGHTRSIHYSSGKKEETIIII